MHAGQKKGKERQNPPRRLFVLAIAYSIKAGGRAPQIDDGKKKGGKPI
jgi:hypothetical protein